MYRWLRVIEYRRDYSEEASIRGNMAPSPLHFLEHCAVLSLLSYTYLTPASLTEVQASDEIITLKASSQYDGRYCIASHHIAFCCIAVSYCEVEIAT